MEKYIVSLNNGIVNPDYSAFQIFDQEGNVVAIARTNKIKLLELHQVKEGFDKEAVINAIKDRFPGIETKDYIDTPR